ncbi:MAG: DUF5684 domain-containing protein [Pelobacteraceae bacterium]
MNVFVRHLVLILFMWLMLAGVCLGKQVYLKDGGIIDSESAWRKGCKVFVKVNRDIIAEFNPGEIDLRRTFPKTGSSSRPQHRKAAAGAKAAATPAAAAPAPKAAIASTPAVATPAAKPVTPPAPAPDATATEPPQPAATAAAPSGSASPPDKAELERRKQEAVKMMTEAMLKKDPDLMKKALEMQKSAMPQQGGTPMPQQGGFPIILLLVTLAVCILIIAGQWIVFQKAGQAGWKCLIPFYNMYVMMEISGKPGWWMFLLLVPLVGIVIYLFAMLSLAKKFGRSELFGVGLVFLPMIFFPVLAFGGSEYEG